MFSEFDRGDDNEKSTPFLSRVCASTFLLEGLRIYSAGETEWKKKGRKPIRFDKGIRFSFSEETPAGYIH